MLKPVRFAWLRKVARDLTMLPCLVWRQAVSLGDKPVAGRRLKLGGHAT